LQITKAAVASSFLKPLMNYLAIEQQGSNSQIDSALCLATAIEVSKPKYIH
jgi:hypothetical protein